DTAGVANLYTIESEPVRYESSFVLAPGFPISPSDATDASSIRAFDRSAPSFSKANRDKYRLYVFDETGEGHWDFGALSVVHNATPLSKLFLDEEGNVVPFVKRR